jgi:K+-transporting ATPase c subunit
MTYPVASFMQIARVARRRHNLLQQVTAMIVRRRTPRPAT